jgi:hypothetical protein
MDKSVAFYFAIDHLKKSLAEEALKLIVARAPFLGSAFINPITTFFVKMLIDVLYDKGALGINWVWSLIENKHELKDALKTREDLRRLLEAGLDTTKVEEEFNEATDDLIKRNHDRLPR